MVHVERMNDCCLPRCLLVCKPVNGKWSAGCLKRRWNDVLMGDLKRCDLLEDWKETVQDRGALEMLCDGSTGRPQQSHGKIGEGKQGCQEDENRGRCAIRVIGTEM